MKENDNRVIMRQGARELGQQELNNVSSALRTAAKCTFTVDPFTGNIDSDVHQC